MGKYDKISQFYNLRKESIFISKNSNFKAFTLEIDLSIFDEIRIT